jgi:purine-binding chemotaxis protein CheW
MNTQNNLINRATQITKVSDQTDALSLYLEGLLSKSAPVVTEETTELEVAPPVESPALAEGRPAWTADPFQVLFIDIYGMEIAIPMSSMSGIRQYPEQLMQMPNQAPWVDGVYQYHQNNIQVIDAHRLLIPEHYTENQLDQVDDVASEKPAFIVQIGDGRWGLACRSAERAVMLNPDQVRWSGSDRKRRWILGMIKEHLCALLDVDEFITHLEQGTVQSR